MQKMNKNYLGKKSILSLGIALSMFSGFSTSALAAPVATATVNKGVNFRADQSTSAPFGDLLNKALYCLLKLPMTTGF